MRGLGSYLTRDDRTVRITAAVVTLPPLARAGPPIVATPYGAAMECAVDCREKLLKIASNNGVDVTVETTEPRFHNRHLHVLSCEHGRRFYMQPTLRQMAKWKLLRR
ncbi:MAG: hypothetical protein ABWY93_04750 [Mycobacterium sp.]